MVGGVPCGAAQQLAFLQRVSAHMGWFVIWCVHPERFGDIRMTPFGKVAKQPCLLESCHIETASRGTKGKRGGKVYWSYWVAESRIKGGFFEERT